VFSSAAVDYWQVLGLTPGADASSLKRAFRQQARRWHPDLNGNDPVAEERFKLVNEAYAVLSDPGRRHSWEAGEAGEGTPSGAELDPFAAGFPAFEDYLERLFGGRPPVADDRIEDGIEDRFEDPSGARSPEPFPEPVPQRGEERGEWRFSGGDVMASPPSPSPVPASGSLETVVDLTPAQALAGERVELELHDGTVVEVWTPPLAGDGWRLRLAGVAPGGGDHFLQLRVRTADGLRIDGLRVLFPLDLSPADATLGCQVAVPTLEGAVRLRVPPGSSSGRLLRLRGRGLRQGERQGDQLVEVRIVVPDRLGEAEEALYRRLRQLEQEEESGAAG
jgi:DnaJ-class molecular chaperone